MAGLEERLKAALADRYAIEREVGQGGMATVFLARDLRHDRKVAVKVLRPELAAAVGHERFVREIKIAAQLQHPHILPLHVSGEAEGFLYYVMPYVEGESLRDRLSREGELPIEDAVRILKEISDALSYAHTHGVVHRDIKPDNVMISGRHSLVMDFGVAKAVSEAAGTGEVTSAGVAIGTPAYMAPEQAAAEEQVDHRVDIYALGVLAYELLTGRPPFSGGSAQQVLSAQVTQKPVPVTQYRESVPPLLGEIVMKCLEKHSADRWQSADELRSELERVATPSQGVSAPQTPAGAAAWAPGLSRRFKRTVGVGVIALAALLVLILRPFGAGAPAADVSPTAVAVLPFSVSGGSGGDDFGYLSEAMVSLLSTKLDGAGDLRSADPRTLLSVAAREFGDRLDPQQGRRLAQRFGAGIYIMGDVVEAGGRLRITASVYEADGDAVSVAQATVDGGSEDLFTLVDELASQLLVSLAGGPGARVTRIAGVTTSSLPAFRAYLEGESAFRNGDYGRAVEAFQQAVEIDTIFALGYYRLSVAAEWDVQQGQSEEAAERAFELAARLPNRDRRLLEAMRLLRRGRHGEAEARYRSLVASYPDDVEAWFHLGEILFHSNPLHGRSFTESREPFERVLTYEPDHGTSIIHLARVAAHERRLDDLDLLAQVVLELYPESDRALEMEALLALSHRDLESESRLDARLREASASILALVSQITGPHVHNPAGTERLTRLLAAPSQPADVRTAGYMSLAHLSLTQGRWQEALARLTELAVFNAGVALEYRTLLSLINFLPVERTELLALREELELLHPASIPRSDSRAIYFNVHDELHPMLKLYLAGALSARLGDSVQAVGYASQLEELPDVLGRGSLADDLAIGIRSQLHYTRGRIDEALRTLEGGKQEVHYQLTLASPFAAQSSERFMRAELLHEVGRDSEALEWYSHIYEIAPFESVYLPISHFRRGEIYEGMGSVDEAIEHYARFVELWENADTELQPMVEDARARIERLGGEPQSRQ